MGAGGESTCVMCLYMCLIVVLSSPLSHSSCRIWTYGGLTIYRWSSTTSYLQSGLRECCCSTPPTATHKHLHVTLKVVTVCILTCYSTSAGTVSDTNEPNMHTHIKKLAITKVNIFSTTGILQLSIKDDKVKLVQWVTLGYKTKKM